MVKNKVNQLFEYDAADVSNRLILIIVLTSTGIFFTYLCYYIFSQIFYNSLHPLYGGWEVFLTARSHLEMNDMKFTKFSEWQRLAVIVPLLIGITCLAYIVALNRRISFWIFLLFVYILCILVEILFLFITTRDGLTHIAIQTRSINNGIYLGIEQVTKQLASHGIKDFISINSMQYFYGEMYANIGPGSYPFVGSTHPPGIFIIIYLVYHLGLVLFPFLDPDAARGMMVALINTSTIIIMGLIVKEMFSERIARLSCVMLLCLPTVAIHFMSVIDGVGSVFIGIGILFLIYAMKAITLSSPRLNILYGVGAGLALTLSAQFTFGHAFPIFAILIGFFISTDYINSEKKKLIQFVAALIIAPASYFIFEYLVSNGKVFYVALALERVKTVTNGLDSRPYPLSQVANFIVMFVMGGIVMFPTVMLSLGGGLTIARNLLGTQTLQLNSKKRIRNYMLYSVFIMFFLLLIQKTVRLEVERTWHWFFLPVWTLMGYQFYGIKIIFRRLFPTKKEYSNLSLLMYFIIQLTITVVLSMSIMDYY